MENNQLTKVTGIDNIIGEVQYVDVKRITPQEHSSIKVLEFYNDIQDIMNTSTSQNLDFEA